MPPKTTGSFDELCAYFNQLRALPVARYVKLYGQRFWPVLMPLDVEDNFGYSKESFPSDFTITETDGELSERLILQVAGVGEYKLRLNDTRRPWKQQTVMFSALNVVDASLWTLHPPIFLPERLDLDAKRNQAYIKFARSHGYLPHDGVKKEQDDMATGQVFQTVMEDAQKARAASESLMKEELERLRRENEGLRTKKEPAAPVSGTQASDIQATARALVDMATSMKPERDNSLSEYLKLETAREETRRLEQKEERDRALATAAAERKRADDLQAQVIADMRVATAAVTVAAAPAPPMTELQRIEEQIKLKKATRELYKGDTHDEDGKPEGGWFSVAPLLLPIAGNIMNNAFQLGMAWFQSLQIRSYNDALTRTGGTPQPPANMTNHEPGKPIPPQAPPATPEQTAQQVAWDATVRGMLKLAKPLLRSLDQGRTGVEFAEQIIQWADEGRMDYDRIRGIADALQKVGIPVEGKDDFEKFKNAVAMALQNIPEVWQRVGALPSFGQFLDEFYHYDEIVAAEQKDGAK